MNGQEITFELPKNIDRYLATLSKYYAKEGQRQLQGIIVNSQARVHAEWSYDSWNGGTYGHALYLAIPESIYLSAVNEKAELQSQIREGLNKIHDIQNEFIEEVFFEMEVPDDHVDNLGSGHAKYLKDCKKSFKNSRFLVLNIPFWVQNCRSKDFFEM